MSVTYEVHEQENGSADIERVKRSPVSDWAQAQSLNVLAEHRAAVALALLGDRDALVERMADLLHRINTSDVAIYATDRQFALEMLRQVFGAAIGGGGEGVR